MTFTIKTFEKYLGNPASDMLSEVPFKEWRYQRSVEDDLDQPVIDYVFSDNGLDFVCDKYDRVGTIFLYAEENRHFEEDLLDIPFSLTRGEVLQRLGTPAKSGNKINDPILGECGAWDRFARSNYAIHIEYRVDTDRIKMITLMREDVVP